MCRYLYRLYLNFVKEAHDRFVDIVARLQAGQLSNRGSIPNKVNTLLFAIVGAHPTSYLIRNGG